MTILRVIRRNVRAGYGPSDKGWDDTSWFIKVEYCLTVGLSRNGRTDRRLVKYVMSVTHLSHDTEKKKNCKARHLCFLCYHDASSLQLQKEASLCSSVHIYAEERTQPIRVEDIW